ncbi:MAG: HAD family hydrolase [Acidobacteriaceae bacterium]
MASKAIRTIFWDCGGVLLTNGWDHRERSAVLQQFSLGMDDFMQRHAEVNDAWEKDEMSVAQYLEHTVFYTPRAFTQEQFIVAMQAQSAVLYSENLQTVAALAASNRYTMALLNNESRVLNDFRIRKFGLQKYFSAFFSSCYVGLRKPETAIYQLALDVLQCTPDGAVFIDDRKENAEAAASLGIHAVQMQSPAQLREGLNRLGIFAG